MGKGRPMSRIVVKLGGAVAGCGGPRSPAGRAERRSASSTARASGSRRDGAARLEVSFVAGRRVTTPEALDVVREALLAVDAELAPRSARSRCRSRRRDRSAGDARAELGHVGEALPTCPAAVVEALERAPSRSSRRWRRSLKSTPTTRPRRSRSGSAQTESCSSPTFPACCSEGRCRRRSASPRRNGCSTRAP